jgi:hypothetical protein
VQAQQLQVGSTALAKSSAGTLQTNPNAIAKKPLGLNAFEISDIQEEKLTPV